MESGWIDIVDKGKLMALDAVEPVEDNLTSVPLAMTAARNIRSLLQIQGAPQDVMNGVRAVEKQHCFTKCPLGLPSRQMN